MQTNDYIELENKYGAHNYHPLDVVISRAEGVWVYDVEGRRYLDCLAAYSAVNQGHCHPKVLQALLDQAHKVTLTSRAFRNDQLALLYKDLHDLTGYDMALPMNSGAEAVETAVKAARKWGYTVKGIPDGQAEIIVCANNFHGRTVTIVSFSTEAQYREGFAPFTPGFRVVPYGDAAAVAGAITPNTCAFLVEPIQGEAGVLIPPPDYLPRLRAVCSASGVLLVLDEIQSGLGRAGATLAADLVGVRGDLITLGKALGGGIVPVSAVVGREDVLGVLTAGTHGSTFGGNPLACAVGLGVVDLLAPGDLQARARHLGVVLEWRLAELVADGLLAGVRQVGLWAGVDVAPGVGLTGREVCERMAERGVLAKDTHGSTIRLAPPLVISEPDLHRGLDALAGVLRAA